jgi:hypothetical protein
MPGSIVRRYIFLQCYVYVGGNNEVWMECWWVTGMCLALAAGKWEQGNRFSQASLFAIVELQFAKCLTTLRSLLGF